jgi:hypothetical protein
VSPGAEKAAAARRPPQRSMLELIRPNSAVILLGLLCALAAIETIAAFVEYRERVHEEDWNQVEGLLAQEPEAPVIVASEWLGPSARMHLPQARRWDSLAFPDLRSFDRFWLLSHARERAWQGPLRAELEELPRPELMAVHRAGELTLHLYRQRVPAERFSLLESVRSVTTPMGRCAAGRGLWSCKEGRVSIRTVEVDYRARRCLAVELDDGVMATVDLGELELGPRLHGHVGFGDFNARLRADPTARVELWIDDDVAGRWVFTDDQGWAAFALALPPEEQGPRKVELRVGTTVGGTWQRDGHVNSPTDTLCLELRGFAGDFEGEAGS